MKRPPFHRRALKGSPSALVVVVFNDNTRHLAEIGCRGLGWFDRGMQAVGRQVSAAASEIAWLVLVDSEPTIYNANEAREVLGLAH